MPRRIRYFTGQSYYFITQRCSEERFFLEPSDAVNHATLGWLARAQEKYTVEIVAYTFMSNHYHLVVRAPRNNLPSFMGYFSANLARAINRIHRHKGAVWHRRYSAIVLLNPRAVAERVAYTENNPVNAGVCERPSEWCGASSAHQAASVMQVSMVHRRPWHREARLATEDESKYTVVHKLTLSPMVKVPGMSMASPTGQRATKPMAYRNGDPYGRPQNPKRGAEPIAFGEVSEIRSYRTMYRGYLEAYKRASPSFRDGQWDVAFPEGSYRPPHHDRPCVWPPPEKTS